MKKFWTNAVAVRSDGGWAVELDGKPLRTPSRASLLVPTEALGRAIAVEWNRSGETIDPRAMPLTGLANAAIDRVAPDRETFAAAIAQYGEGDLACYRAEFPSELTARQSESWDALLGWARRRFDVDFVTTCGIVHVEQPPETVRRLRHAVAALDPFRLAGLSQLVTIGGSLIAGLALLEGALSAAEAWAAVTIDEQWQQAQWGSDPEAERALEGRKSGFFAAAEFLELLGVA